MLGQNHLIEAEEPENWGQTDGIHAPRLSISKDL